MKKIIFAFVPAALWFSLYATAAAAAPVFDLQLSADVSSPGPFTGPAFPNPGFVETVTVPAGRVSNVNIYGGTRFLGTTGVRGSVNGSVTSRVVMRWRATGCPPEASCSFFSAHGDDPMFYPWSAQNINYPLTYPSAPYLDVQINEATPARRYDLTFTVEEDPASCAGFDGGCMTPVTKTFTVEVMPAGAPLVPNATDTDSGLGSNRVERLTRTQVAALVVIVFATTAGLTLYLRRRMLRRKAEQPSNDNR